PPPISPRFPYTTLFRSTADALSIRSNTELAFSANSGSTLQMRLDSTGELEIGPSTGNAHIDPTVNDPTAVTYGFVGDVGTGMYQDRKSTRLNSSHVKIS